MKKNKILIVGGTANWAIETYYRKYLNKLGLATTIFDCSQYYNISSIFHRIRNRLGDITIYKNVNSELIKYCILERPTIVWIFKGIEIYTTTLKSLKNLGIFLVNYNPDHPFIRTAISHGGKNIENSIPLYDLHFCYSQDLREDIEKKYKIPTAFLPFGYELKVEDYANLAHLEEDNKVCFLGNPDKIRVNTILDIVDKKIPVAVYGHGWDKTRLKYHPLVKIQDAVYGFEFWQKLRQYRVQLNIFRPHNIGSHNMRTFEIPAVGGIQLTPFSTEQAAFFFEGKEVFFYKNPAELIDKIIYIQSLPLSVIDTIRNSARNKSILSAYKYADRAQTVYNIFQSLV